MSALVDLRRYVYLLGYRYTQNEIVRALEVTYTNEKEANS